MAPNRNEGEPWDELEGDKLERLCEIGWYPDIKEYVLTLLKKKDQELQKAREESGKRNAVVKEYQDEGVMFVLKVEDGKTYEASMPIPKWVEVGKLTLRDQSELDQPTHREPTEEEEEIIRNY